MSGPASRLQVALLVFVVTLAVASGVLHRWWARRADETAQTRYRALRRGMPLSEAEQVLAMTAHQPSLDPAEIVTSAAHDVWLGDPESTEYSNGGRYRIILKLNSKNQTISGMMLYRQERYFLHRMIDDIKFAMQSKSNEASLP